MLASFRNLSPSSAALNLESYGLSDFYSWLGVEVELNSVQMWFRVAVRGKPVHVLEAGSGINAIEASYERSCFVDDLFNFSSVANFLDRYVLYGALKKLEEQMNEPGVRHPAYKDFKHPINFNFGVVHGGDWPSSVPSFCQFDVRVGFFPGVAIKDIQRAVEDCISQAAASNPVPITYVVAL